MSWKPCRGGGVMIDRFQRKETANYRIKETININQTN